MKVKEGDNFPEFNLKADDGRTISTSQLNGRFTIIYFYPKDDTPGCTKEACGFRDYINEFNKLGLSIFGISVDGVESHQKFKRKYSIPFTLLSDSNKELISALGIKSIIGAASRVTFILDKATKIIKIYPKVSPDKHAEEILSFVKSVL